MFNSVATTQLVSPPKVTTPEIVAQPPTRMDRIVADRYASLVLPQ